MTFIDSIEEILNAGFVKNKGSLYVRLYKEAFPLNESLKENCDSCYNLAFQRLLYEKKQGYKNIMAKTKKQKEDTSLSVNYKLVNPANKKVFKDSSLVGVPGVGVFSNATLTGDEVKRIIKSGHTEYLLKSE